MSTIAQILRDRNGHAGSNGAWHCYSYWRDMQTGEVRYGLDHYGTLMLDWSETADGTISVIHAGTGWGTVSDQGGMNIAFRVLGLNLRMDRDQRGGGPRISETTSPPYAARALA